MSVLPEIDLEFTERAMGCGQKVKNRSLLRNCGVKLVAWGGIEPPTRGFSTHLSKLLTVLHQALAAS